ncbi:hypothetical protein NHQ30_010596 [Ciborinia camelliae]|nr:hypothetical protein NHQ30_010596 [Ciborinia camelliae]
MALNLFDRKIYGIDKKQFVQVAIAAISLTYGFDVSTESYLFAPGSVLVPDMKHFYPQGRDTQLDIGDEEYTAHAYGALPWIFGINDSIDNLPPPREIYQDLAENDIIWKDLPNNKMVFVFTEYSSSGLLGVYTNRTLDMHYSCSSHKVLSGYDNDNLPINITVQDIGRPVYVSSFVANETTFFTDYPNSCPGIPRCSIIQAFEASDTDPWYYTCNITLGNTKNDEHNISFISDDMAAIAAAAIATQGYLTYDNSRQEASFYPQKSLWGTPMHGNAVSIGIQIASFGLSSISGAAEFNPVSSYFGSEPHTGFALQVNHTYFFLLIVFLIPLVQFLMCFGIAVWANRVVVQENAYLGMSMLLRPIADAVREGKDDVYVSYEKGEGGRWGFAMT